MTSKDKQVLIDGLKKLSADVADLVPPPRFTPTRKQGPFSQTRSEKGSGQRSKRSSLRTA